MNLCDDGDRTFFTVFLLLSFKRFCLSIVLDVLLTVEKSPDGHSSLVLHALNSTHNRIICAVCIFCF